MLAKDESDERIGGGTQSLDAALKVLEGVARFKEPVALSELAKYCGMQPSKVHRYLTSFQRARMVAQTGRSGRYFLGVGAMQLGLAAIGRHDFVNDVSDGLADLRSDSHMTVLLSVWGNEGATVIRWERAESPAVTSMGLGTTLPLLNSATGRAFLAWTHRPVVQTLLEAELRRARRSPTIAPDMELTSQGIEAMVEKTRTRGYATIEGKYIPGLVAIAAPILDWQQEAQCVVTLIGTDPAAIAPGSQAVQQLLEFSRGKSVATAAP
jgi:DNA-binding IclR family transcriptional regulator